MIDFSADLGEGSPGEDEIWPLIIIGDGIAQSGAQAELTRLAELMENELGDPSGAARIYREIVTLRPLRRTRKLCVRLVTACPSCGAPNAPTSRFCGECGSSLGVPADSPGTAGTTADPGVTPSTRSSSPKTPSPRTAGRSSTSPSAAPCSGESPTVSVDEHAELIKVAVEHAAGRVPVIAGVGGNSTREAIELSRHAQEVGADAGLSVVPYYNRPTQEGMYQHFRAIAEAVDLPQFLYNVPGRTVADLQNDTVLRLAQIPNIIGIKDATGDLARGGHRGKDPDVALGQGDHRDVRGEDRYRGGRPPRRFRGSRARTWTGGPARGRRQH